ncbi:MAG: 50S ribosomal protein L23 [Candidatus Beckwithbacteria bacterium]|nr:50S ribosomal protein L23 [Candidatus Beckwithbacteria bacterium]
MLLKPVISEKSMRLAQSGQFTFGVSKETTKTQVRELVEKAFNVNVLKVRMLTNAAKSHRTGKRGFSVTLAAKHKTVVTLKPGQMIEYFAVPEEKKAKKVKKEKKQ